jgi:hypothetical protein
VYTQPHERTLNGLLLIIIGLLLGWIPYVSFVGGLLAIVGIFFLFFGRHEFEWPHPRNVVYGAVLYLISFILVIALAVWFVLAILAVAPAPGQPPSQIDPVFTSDFQTFLYGVLAAAVLVLFAEVLFVYALADEVTRYLLWSGIALQFAISTVIAVVVSSGISNAVQQATNGTSINTGPITALQGQEQILSLLNVFPALVLALAYYRTRERVKSGQIPRAPTRI